MILFGQLADLIAGLSADWIAILVVASFVGGLLDAIAGGGGLIVVPALLLAGLDPVTAIATNKVAASAGAGSATWVFARKGLIDWRSAWPFAALAFIGAVAGAFALAWLPVRAVQAALPALLIGMAFYFAFSPRLTQSASKARLGRVPFMAIVPPVVGFYDGAFGPGAGSFYMLGFVALRGEPVLHAAALTRFVNLASNLGALLFFAMAGSVIWSLGLAMALANILGARLGAMLAIAHGARIVKPLIVAVCLAVVARLLSDPAHPWRAGF